MGRASRRTRACAYRGLRRRLLGPRQVWLGSSLEAAGAPPSTTVVLSPAGGVQSKAEAWQLPNPQTQGGLGAPPSHPSLSQMGKPRQEVGKATVEGPAQPVITRAKDAQYLPLVGWTSPTRSVSPWCFSNEPQDAQHPHLQPPVPVVRGLACRWGLPGLVFIPWPHHVVKGRKEENGRMTDSQCPGWGSWTVTWAEPPCFSAEAAEAQRDVTRSRSHSEQGQSRGYNSS